MEKYYEKRKLGNKEKIYSINSRIASPISHKESFRWRWVTKRDFTFEKRII